MPQYRLFGDTVDVAGMMTITGEGQPRIEIKLFETDFQYVIMTLDLHSPEDPHQFGDENTS